MAAENDQQRRQRESGGNIESTLAALVGVLIVFLVVMVCIQIVNVVSERSIEEPERPAVTPREQAEQALADAQQALKETDETRDTLDLLLSLLQGGAILAGLALGAAAYFGFRNSKETQEQLETRISERLNNLPNVVQAAIPPHEQHSPFAAPRPANLVHVGNMLYPAPPT
ncbi:MAG TPA: hypothetical protein VHP83_11160 [Aggregatilineaceae bacterium]|nr:hypothetical protein [Aggregatilineaceae bacterium]